MESEMENSYADIKNEMKQMSFGELMKLENKLGSELFNEIYQGKEITATTSNSSSSKKGSRSLSRQSVEISPQKDAPMELSSKRPTSRLRNVIPSSKRKSCDPRFDNKFGEYNDQIFRRNYEFIKDTRERDKKQLKRMIKREKDEDLRNQLSTSLQQMSKEDSRYEARTRRDQHLSAIKSSEKEMVKKGKKPYFMKKSDMKNLQLMEQFEELKSSGKLEKYLKTKRKRKSQKQRKYLPS